MYNSRLVLKQLKCQKYLQHLNVTSFEFIQTFFIECKTCQKRSTAGFGAHIKDLNYTNNQNKQRLVLV